MSSLTTADKLYPEKVLGMGGGYILDFNDERFEQFSDRYGIDIHSARYQVDGTSKTRKMRVFWGNEPDTLVGRVLLTHISQMSPVGLS